MILAANLSSEVVKTSRKSSRITYLMFRKKKNCQPVTLPGKLFFKNGDNLPFEYEWNLQI